MKKEDLKIVFFGTPEFAVTSLDKIIGEGFNVVAAVTMPDKPAGRGHKMFHSPVKEYAEAHNIPLMQPVRLKDETFLSELRSYNADLFIVIAFRMLPEAVWQMPPMGTFNLHASLLPRYRGAAPINWAVINGDTETGVTTFFLKHEIDTGDIISQEKIDILPTDNVGDVHDRLMELGATLTIDTINHILAGDLTPIPQDQLLNGEEPTPAPKIFKDTCHINWEKSATEVHNLVRGLSPYPAAWAELHATDDSNHQPISIKVFSTAVSSESSTAAKPTPGTVTINNSRLFVWCGNGQQLEILELQPAGKRRMATSEFLRGARLPENCIMR
jgi:methionyl-tRNA formyltransferase